MSFFSKISKALPVLRKAESAAGAAVGAVAHKLASDVRSPSALKQDVLDAPATAAEAALQKLFGPTFLAQAQLPPYTPLPQAALDAARARSQGLTAPQPCIRGTDGHPHEPVCLTVAGTSEQLQAALQKAGWVRAQADTTSERLLSGLAVATAEANLPIQISNPDSPMSTMCLDGKPMAMAFEKNNDHHRGRDHLRVFATGQTDASGRPIWAIAATRDIAFKLNTANLSASHQIDPHIDRERDMVMADLLGTGDVASWNVAHGVRTAADDAAVKRAYQTDGALYQVALE